MVGWSSVSGANACPRRNVDREKLHRLLHEETGEQRATAEMQTSTGRRIGQYVLGLMAAMFNRRSETKV